MLLLKRGIGEKVVISDNITVTVVDIERGKVRLGFDAPREIPIFREELIDGQPKDDTPPEPVVDPRD